MVLRSLLLIASLVATAGTAVAQACTIDTGRPAQLAGARSYINRIGGGERQGEKPNHLRSGARVLVEQSEKIDNQIGRWYLLGKLYALWLNQPGAEPITTRGFLTLAGPQDEPVDLFVEIAAAFDKVEAINPACVDSTKTYRMVVYGRAYNAAIEARNAELYDSAEYMAKRALILNPKSAAAWNLIASARMGKKDDAGYQEALQKVIEVGEGDESALEARKAAIYNLGVLRLNEAMGMQGAEQTARAKEAEALFRQFLTLAPGAADASAGLARALRVMGDTSGMESIFATMLTDPANYTAGQLFEAGVSSAQAEEWEMAVKLLEAGLEKNPFYRDALFNLANAAFSMDDADKMLATLQRLVAVDPSNADNYRLMAGAWQRVGRNATDEALKTAAQDSLLFYLEKSQKMPAHLKASLTSVADGAVLSGTIENRGEAPASYTVEVEFLDARGAVVTTATVTVTDVPPNSAKEFRVEGKGAGLAAYRYKPIG